jgi:hypothetical protein
VLTELYVNDNLARLLIPRERYRPFPTADDRRAWEALPRALREAHVAAAEGRLGKGWPVLPATLFMEYRRIGNRSHYERAFFDRRHALADLVVAECVEGEGRFLDEIINGIWCVCEESFWGVPAHSSARRFPDTPLPDTSDRIIDLFAGETAGLLAWTHYLLSAPLDAVSPVLCDRIRREVKERILGPYLARDDFRWMGLDEAGRTRPVNNWNPWCNSNCLTAALLLEEDPERRVAAVAKALRSLDRFLDAYHPDGGCDEGTSYWDRAGGSLFDCLELLHGATGGKIDVYDDPLVANIGRYLYRAYISGNYFINFADGGARVNIAADLVYRYGRRIGDAKLMALGSSAHHRRQAGGRVTVAPESLTRRLPALFNHEPLDAATAEPPYVRDVWLDGIEVMAAREQESSDRGLYLAAKGGHNSESHNHNDVGQFIVYRDGEPILIDVGVETYTAKTFSPRRYEIWTMQSAYHNLPTVGGVQQAAGREFAAREAAWGADDAHAQLSLNLAGAYPQAAGIVSWRRTLRLERDARPAIFVRDGFTLRQPSEVTLSLMTPCEPRLDQPGVILLPGAHAVRVEFPGDALEAASERIDIEDARLVPVWGDHLFRVTLKGRGPVSEGDWELRITAA